MQLKLIEWTNKHLRMQPNESKNKNDQAFRAHVSVFATNEFRLNDYYTERFFYFILIYNYVDINS